MWPAALQSPVADRLRVALVVVIWLACCDITLVMPGFGVDHWSVYELAGTLRDFPEGFYRVNTVRQYEWDTPWGNSFPPLYPVVLGVGRWLAPQLGIYVSWPINCLVLLGWWPLCRRIMHHLGGRAWWGDLLYILVLSNFLFLVDALHGGSGLAMLLVLGVLDQWLDPRPFTAGRAAVVGVLAGLACLSRFDALPLAATLVAVTVWRAYRQSGLAPSVASAGSGRWPSAKPVAAIALAMGITLSPWVVYGLLRFGKPLPSDNARQALSVHKIHVSEFYPPDDPDGPRFLAEAPAAWLHAYLTEKCPPLLRELAREVVRNSVVPWVALGLLVAAGASHRWPPLRSALTDTPGLLLMAFGLGLLVQLAGIAATGYTSWRYYAPLVVWLNIVLLRLAVLIEAPHPGASGQIATEVAPPLPSDAPRGLWSPVLTTAVVAVAGLLMFVQHWRCAANGWSRAIADWPHSVYYTRSHRWDRDLLEIPEAGPIVREMARTVELPTSQPRLLYVFLDAPSRIDKPFRFGALTGTPCVVMPSNLTAARLPGLLARYRPTHVYDDDGRLMAMFAQRGLVCQPTAVPHLWVIPQGTLDSCHQMPCRETHTEP